MVWWVGQESPWPLGGVCIVVGIEECVSWVGRVIVMKFEGGM